jgi:hypothetical protein
MSDRTDRILDTFLQRQHDEALALAAESDIVHVVPLPRRVPPDRYLVAFDCTGLVQAGPGRIVEADHFEVGVWFPSDYLRTADPFRVVTWLGPRHVWHPNIAADAPAICVGRLVPGTSLVDLIYQVFEIITWNKVTMREDDALNRAACQWARSHRERLRIDRRPLKRRALDLRIEDAGERSANDGQM